MRALGDALGMVEALERIALLAGALGCSRRAAQLWAATGAMREAIGMPLAPHDQAEHEQAMAVLRAALGQATFAAAWAAGEVLSQEEAIAQALEGMHAGDPVGGSQAGSCPAPSGRPPA